ncbi:MAG TPA: RtcB family protein [Euryarchaeota archaeon]|nr:RtcB family protein [Euryarchaeota archaeon]
MNRWNGPLEKIDEFRYLIPNSYKQGMRTDGVIYSDSRMLEQVMSDNALEQVSNVAMLPGIVGRSLAMPDIHWGYGFPIGGVAAMDAEEGVISPGGVGYDINCGVRLLRTGLYFEDVKDRIKNLVDEMFVNVPSGLGSKGKVRVDDRGIVEVLEGGARWAVEKGYGTDDDLKHQEASGCLEEADAGKVSQMAKQRGMPQIGSLGAGNHFLEIQKVEEIFDAEASKAMGIDTIGQIVVMIHSGSRGAGYQIASDYIKIMEGAVKKYGISLPDRQLACAPVTSDEAQDYFAAMSAGANFAWANRQLIMHWVRESFEKVLRQPWESMEMRLVYDVAHNIAKKETHQIEGAKRSVIVHRKGATRAFGPHHPEVPTAYSKHGQPVIIPGDMGTSSYVLTGTEGAMSETFGSTCHGAGRVLSRSAAIRRFTPEGIRAQLSNAGIYVKAASPKVLTEEAPQAYKRIDDVVRVANGAGISKLVAKMIPLGVMKG